MMTSTYDLAEPARGAPFVQERSDIGDLVTHLGRPSFESELVRCLHEMYGADHLFVCQDPAGKPRMLATASFDGSRAAEGMCNDYFVDGMWRFDPAMGAGGQCSPSRNVLIHLNIETPETSELRNFYARERVSERVLVFGHGPDGTMLQVSIVRSQRNGAFSSEQRGRLGLLARTFIPMLAKHQQLRRQGEQLPHAVTSLDAIEHYLAQAPERMSRRESQVIARTLYGLTATGIALDLGIGFETVISYRKNFYRRSMIGGYRELLVWYLKLYTEVSQRTGEAPARMS